MKPTPTLQLFSIIIFMSIAYSLRAQPKIAYTPVVTGLSNPVDAVFAPGDGRLFIAQQNGLIRIRNGASLTNFINISSVLTSPAGGEQGLLSLAFHPNYASNRYFFVMYTGTTGDITLARYRRNISDANTADLSSGQELLRIPKPGSPYYTNHNGGKIIFGSDGYLYMSTGDGGNGGDPFNLSQNRASLLGKLLRIDVNGFATSAPWYAIPPDNPFASPSDGFSDEIFSYGLRNPWRWSFDRSNGDVWIADVGQGNWEEINHNTIAQANGGNYGWRCYEGAHNYNTSGCSGIDSISPIAEYGHNSTTGGYSITGGYVYRGSVFPSLQGFYMATDYITGHIWLTTKVGNSWQTFFQSLSEGGLTANVAGYAEGPTGEWYAILRGAGRIDSVTVTSTVPVVIHQFTVRAMANFNLLQWSSSSEENILRYHIEYSPDGLQFSPVATITPRHRPSQYSYSHLLRPNGKIAYRLAIVNADGSLTYSNIVWVNKPAQQLIVYPSLLHRGASLTIEAQQPIQELQLLSSNGTMLYRQLFHGNSASIPYKLPAQIAAGMHLLRVKTRDDVQVQKIQVR